MPSASHITARVAVPGSAPMSGRATRLYASGFVARHRKAAVIIELAASHARRQTKGSDVASEESHCLSG